MSTPQNTQCCVGMAGFLAFSHLIDAMCVFVYVLNWLFHTLCDTTKWYTKEIGFGINAIHSLYAFGYVCRIFTTAKLNETTRKPTKTATFLIFGMLWIYLSTPIISSISRMPKMFSFSVSFRSISFIPIWVGVCVCVIVTLSLSRLNVLCKCGEYDNIEGIERECEKKIACGITDTKHLHTHTHTKH